MNENNFKVKDEMIEYLVDRMKKAIKQIGEFHKMWDRKNSIFIK